MEDRQYTHTRNRADNSPLLNSIWYEEIIGTVSVHALFSSAATVSSVGVNSTLIGMKVKRPKAAGEVNNNETEILAVRIIVLMLKLRSANERCRSTSSWTRWNWKTTKSRTWIPCHGVLRPLNSERASDETELNWTELQQFSSVQLRRPLWGSSATTCNKNRRSLRVVV